jgi:hypothetical protein
MGVAFGAFLSGLSYQDGQLVDLVDSVACSMGGPTPHSHPSWSVSYGYRIPEQPNNRYGFNHA